MRHPLRLKLSRQMQKRHKRRHKRREKMLNLLATILTMQGQQFMLQQRKLRPKKRKMLRIKRRITSWPLVSNLRKKLRNPTLLIPKSPWHRLTPKRHSKPKLYISTKESGMLRPSKWKGEHRLRRPMQWRLPRRPRPILIKPIWSKLNLSQSRRRLRRR